MNWNSHVNAKSPHANMIFLAIQNKKVHQETNITLGKGPREVAQETNITLGKGPREVAQS
jgi:hypothetical protein